MGREPFVAAARSSRPPARPRHISRSRRTTADAQTISGVSLTSPGHGDIVVSAPYLSGTPVRSGARTLPDGSRPGFVRVRSSGSTGPRPRTRSINLPRARRSSTRTQPASEPAGGEKPERPAPYGLCRWNGAFGDFGVRFVEQSSASRERIDDLNAVDHAFALEVLGVELRDPGVRACRDEQRVPRRDLIISLDSERAIE